MNLQHAKRNETTIKFKYRQVFYCFLFTLLRINDRPFRYAARLTPEKPTWEEGTAWMLAVWAIFASSHPYGSFIKNCFLNSIELLFLPIISTLIFLAENWPCSFKRYTKNFKYFSRARVRNYLKMKIEGYNKICYVMY